MISISKHNKWELSLSGKALALLSILLIHSQHYAWWVYLFVIFVGSKLEMNK